MGLRFSTPTFANHGSPLYAGALLCQIGFGVFSSSEGKLYCYSIQRPFICLCAYRFMPTEDSHMAVMVKRLHTFGHVVYYIRNKNTVGHFVIGK